MSDFISDLSSMSLEERQLLVKKLELKKLQLESAKGSRDSFSTFVKNIWPDFIEGRHHKIIAKKLEAIKDKKINRLIVNMPPRHTKSEFASFLFPAWMMGNNPKLKIIQTTHTAELAYRFGRKVRNLMNEQEYKSVFPDTELRADSQAAGRWETNHGGEYFAAGVGGSITGRGADLLIIDDPHSEQDALSKTAMENAWEWYTSGPRQRLQPGGAIVVVMTRWSEDDLTDRLIEAQMKDDNALTSGRLWISQRSWTTDNRNGQSSGNSINWRRSKLHCPWANGTHSGNKNPHPKRQVLSNESGGNCGRNRNRLCNILFKVMIQPSLVKRPLTIQRLPLGEFFIMR
jgi:hypothetical protein